MVEGKQPLPGRRRFQPRLSVRKRAILVAAARPTRNSRDVDGKNERQVGTNLIEVAKDFVPLGLDVIEFHHNYPQSVGEFRGRIQQALAFAKSVGLLKLKKKGAVHIARLANIRMSAMRHRLSEAVGPLRAKS